MKSIKIILSLFFIFCSIGALAAEKEQLNWAKQYKAWYESKQTTE